MKVFWIVLLATYVLCMIGEGNPTITFGKDGNKTLKINKRMYLIVSAILVLVSGLREGVGDTGTYKHLFTQIPANGIEFLKLDTFQEDRGFYFFVSLIKQFISVDNQVIIFVLALITIGLICYGLYKYTDDVKMAVFLFIATGCFATSMNGIRQYLAAAILFAALPLIRERKMIPYFIIVFLCSTVHASAIIFYPIYFLNYFKGWGMMSYALLFAGAILFITYETTGPLIAEIIGESQYGHYSDALISTDQGANMLRILVYFVPVALSWLGKNRINKYMEYGNIMINLNIINFLVMLLANKYWIYARFCIYFNVYSVALLAFCLNNIFEKRSAKIIKALCIACYVIYFWYDSLTSGLVYSSKYIKL